jgi:hypothetical protein
MQIIVEVTTNPDEDSAGITMGTSEELPMIGSPEFEALTEKEKGAVYASISVIRAIRQALTGLQDDDAPQEALAS